MNTFELLALIILVAIAWFWYTTIRARELGVAAARSACERNGLQFLDETVSLRTIRSARNHKGHVTFRRVYEFEFSGSGFDRQSAAVVLLGNQVEMIDIDSIVERHE